MGKRTRRGEGHLDNQVETVIKRKGKKIETERREEDGKGGGGPMAPTGANHIHPHFNGGNS